MEKDINKSEDIRFHQLQEDAKSLARNGKIAESIKLFQEAYKINPTKKVKKRIEKLQAFLEEYGDEIEESMIEVDDKFYLYHELYKKLYPYQRDGIKWLWNLYKKRKGGVLGDDMGLGKTIQIIAFLSGMFDMDAIKFVLIIMPVSLLPNWEKEFKKWTPGLCTHCFHGSSKRERERMLMKTQNRGGILLTSYGMIVNNVDLITTKDGRQFVWDYVILDEAHKIKNPTKTTKAVHSIPAKDRIALTGTPIQNNLLELWSLYDFVQQGTLLGSLRTFKMQYETPISRSREKDATVGERKLGVEIAENLLKMIQPYFLRRTKLEVLSQKNTEGLEHLNEVNLQKEFVISRKNDFIIWLYLSPKQVAIYKDFLELDRVKSILMTKRSPLVELTVLKKICDHPRLLSKRACIQLGLDGDVPGDVDDELDDDTASAVSIDNVTDEDLIEESQKLRFLLSLLSNLRECGHRTLLFSQSRKMLDIVHRILLNSNWKVMRIDGTINKIEERQKRIQRFQEDLSIPVFLLTTQVGGVGFTLTGADRVVIYDPSWNPATDAQAVDRVYRIGQDKNVVIYRLITCSTVEEKIYRRQIFKDSITQQATGGSKDPHRYFTKQELRELFTLENPYHSATQVQLEEMHSQQRNSDALLDEHIAFLYSLNIFGISDHDLMFTGEQIDDAEENFNDEIMGEEYIRKRVENAQQLLHVECANALEDNEKCNTYARPYTLSTIPVRNNATKDTYKPPMFPDVDLNDVNKSLQYMSVQNDSIDICDSSAVLHKTVDLIEDTKLDASVEFKSCENDSGRAIIIPDDKDGYQENQNPSAPATETLIQRRPRKSLLYVPESDDDDEIVNSDASGDLFVRDSEESHESNEDSSPSIVKNTEYRNKSIHSETSQLQNHLNWKPDSPGQGTFSPSKQSLHSSSVSLAIEDDDVSFSEDTNNKNKNGSEEKSHSSRMKVSDISYIISSNSIDEADIALPDINAPSIEYKTKTSQSENQIIAPEFGERFKNQQSPILSVSAKDKFSPFSSKRITPLKITQLQNFSPENSLFQKALLQSVELHPATSSPLHTVKAEKSICNSAGNSIALLKSERNKDLFSTSKCDNQQNETSDSLSESVSTQNESKYLQNISEMSAFDNEYDQSSISSDSNDGSLETSENKSSVVRNLSHELELASKCNESDCSPVHFIRKHHQRIMDSSDESDH